MNAEENYESEVPPSSVHQDGPLGGHGAPGYGGCMLLVDTTHRPVGRMVKNHQSTTNFLVKIPGVLGKTSGWRYPIWCFLCSGCLVQQKASDFLHLVFLVGDMSNEHFNSKNGAGTVLLGVRAFWVNVQLVNQRFWRKRWCVFFSEDFSYKNGRKKQQQDGLRSIPLIDFDPRWLLPIPFSLGWMFRWIHLPMVPDPYGYRSLSTLVLECFRMTKGSSWDFLFQPVPCFWYSREENHIHTIIMNHGLIELGDCVCTSL